MIRDDLNLPCNFKNKKSNIGNAVKTLHSNLKGSVSE